MRASRLADFERLNKYIPANKRGDVCPNNVPALVGQEGEDCD